MSGTFTVQVIGDENIESDEAFNVTLSGAVGATIDDDSAVGTITNDDFATGTIVGRHVFYNGSSLDGGNLDANAADDAAIATDKTALLPGGSAEFANYTSYLGGITGVMIDIAGIGNAAGIGTNDFELLVGDVDDVSTWTEVPVPTSIMVRSVDEDGDTLPDFDRVTLTFAAGSIVGRWLSVTVTANTDTGIPNDDTLSTGPTHELALQSLLIEDESPTLENDPLDVENALPDRPESDRADESELADEVFALIGDQEM